MEALDTLRKKYQNDEKNADLEWLMNQQQETKPAPPREPAKPEEVKGWFEDFAKTTAADVSVTLSKGLTLGIISTEDIPWLGRIVTENKTPEERKSALRKVGEFATEMSIGGAPKWTWAVLGKIGGAAARIIAPTAGKVVQGAVRGAAEMTALGGTQATVQEAKEATGISGTPEQQAQTIGERALEVGGKTLFSAAFGGVAGAGAAKLEQFIIDRRTERAKEAFDTWQAEHGKWRESISPPPQAKERLALPPGKPIVAGPGKEPIPAGPIPPEPGPMKALPPAPEPPVTIPAKDLFKKADELEALKPDMPGQAWEPMQQRIGELRQQGQERAAVEIAEQVGKGLEDPDTLARVTQAIDEGRIVLPTGKTSRDIQTEVDVTKAIREGKPPTVDFGPEGSASVALTAALARAALGAAVGAYSGDTPEERVERAMIGAGLGALLSPALFKKALTKIVDQLDARFPVATAETLSSGATVGGRPVGGGRKVRMNAPANPDEISFILEGSPSGEIKDKLFTINLAEWEKNPDRIKDLYRKMAEVYGTGKRPVKIDEDLIAAAKKKLESGEIVQTLLGIKPGEMLNDVEMMSTALLLKTAEHELVTRMDRFIADGVPTADFANWLGFSSTILKAAKGATGEIGAALRTTQFVHKVMADPQLAVVQDLTEILGGDDAMRLVQGMTTKEFRTMLTDVRDRAMRDDPKSWPSRAWEFTKNLGNGAGEAYVMDLLSGPVTQLLNIGGDSWQLAWNVTQRGFAEKFLAGKVPGVAEGETAAMLSGITDHGMQWMKVMSDSAKRNYTTMAGRGALGAAFGAYTGDTWDEKMQAALTYGTLAGVSGLGKGVAPFGATTQWVEGATARITAEKLLGPLGLDASAWYGKGLDLLGEIIRIPGDNMKIADNLFHMMGYGGELSALTWREAVRRSRLTGNDVSMELERLAQGVPDEIKAAAKHWGDRSVFANDLKDVSKFAANVQTAISDHPVLRLRLPFWRTPINLAVRGAEMIPGLDLISKEFREMWSRGGADRQLVEAQFIMGSMVTGVAAAMAYKGLLPGRHPKGLEEIYKAKGIPEYAVKAGDHYIPINQVDPVAWPLMFMADFVQFAGQVSPEERQDYADAIWLSFTGMLRNKVYAKEFSQLAEVLNDQSGARITDYFSKWSSSVVPSAMAAMARYTDPFKHHLTTARDRFMARVPGQSTEVPYEYDLIGRPIPMPPGFGPDTISPVYDFRESNHPVLNALMENKTPGITRIRDFVKGKDPEAYPLLDPTDPSLGTRLLGQERAAWAERSGKLFEKYGMQDIQSSRWNTMTKGPYGEQSQTLRASLTLARREVFEDIVREHPRLAQEIDAIEVRREEALYGPRPGAVQLGPGLTIR